MVVGLLASGASAPKQVLERQMKSFGQFFALIALSVVSSACQSASLPGAETLASSASVEVSDAPNVIVILADDLGYMDVGFSGGVEIPTPNIDRIANEGVRFSQGYVSHPVCGPSRAGLLTGRYQGKFGFFQNPNNDPRDPMAGLPLSEKLIPELIAPAGYKSIAIGKWHMGAHESLRPLKRGFDEFFGFLSGTHHYFADEFLPLAVNEVQIPNELHRTRLRRGDIQVEASGYLTDLLSNDAVRFIEENEGTPFFIYLAYNAPHIPLEATEKYLDRFSHIKDEKRRTYAAMVSAVDDGVGRILDTLDRDGIAENTIVFFLSDNGGIVRDEKSHPDYAGAEKGSVWNGSDNGALRAGKGTMFEGGNRVPFAMRWPRKVPAGMVYNKPVISLDIVRTIMDENGLSAPDSVSLDGVNLIPQLLNADTETEPRTLFWRQNPNLGRRRFAMVYGDKKYYSSERDDLIHVYDLANDLSETTNIASEESSFVDQANGLIADWIKDMPQTHVNTTSSDPWRPYRDDVVSDE